MFKDVLSLAVGLQTILQATNQGKKISDRL